MTATQHNHPQKYWDLVTSWITNLPPNLKLAFVLLLGFTCHLKDMDARANDHKEQTAKSN